MLRSKTVKCSFNLVIVVCILLLSITAYANENISIIDLKDIDNTQWFYADVNTLIQNNIINGYPDNTFRPKEKVKVNEFIKMVVTALNLEVKGNPENWEQGYINKAIEKGLITEKEFDNYDRSISRGEMSRIIFNSIDEKYNDDIKKYSAHIKDYSDIQESDKDMALKVYSKGIITGFPDGTFGFDKTATRAEASVIIVRMLYHDRRILPSDEWSNKTDFEYRGIDIGISEKEVIKLLENPDRIDVESSGDKWYVYNKDYSKFGMILIKDNKVAGYYTNSTFTNVNGLTIDSSIDEIKKNYPTSITENYVTINNKDYKAYIYIYDKKVLGLLVLDSQINYKPQLSQSNMVNMELQLYDIVNAERVKRDLYKLIWSEKANISARLHSIDMAENDYFDHNNKNGKSPFDRMQAQGIKYMAAGENIAAGQKDVFEVHSAWMNSEGHRANILNEKYTHLGIGIGAPTDKYYPYYTQNFYKPMD